VSDRKNIKKPNAMKNIRIPNIKKGVPQNEVLQKTQKRNKISVTKKQTMEILEKIDRTAKKVSELKGFELSHDIADLMALISEYLMDGPS